MRMSNMIARAHISICMTNQQMMAVTACARRVAGDSSDVTATLRLSVG